ncbi:MAG: hypothetical protein M3Z96_00270 [Pseudomonadota bacterium]|nr:hypothetical protein [Pseudomonadota bacterium]
MARLINLEQDTPTEFFIFVNQLTPGYCQRLVTEATKRRASSLTASIRFSELTPGVASGNGLGHRGAAAALLKLLREIDRSYKIEGGAAVLGLVRFLAQIVPKCFT